ncbi:MAG: class I SAM-dependent methyltransferase [Candidatus Micrarchaeia archaeon]
MQKQIKLEAAFLSSEFGPHEKILDIGSRDGKLEVELKRFDITGVESSKDMLIQARKSSKKLFVKGVAANLPFLQNEFSGAIMHIPSRYIENCERAVAEIYTVLEKRGKLVVFVSGHAKLPLSEKDSSIASMLLECMGGKFSNTKIVELDKSLFAMVFVKA